jgi:glucose-1-phosphate thymidylyltransferase
MRMKGIILAGGAGTRLEPLTLAVSKQLLPVYDKPMIYYPLSTLMLAGISEILVISTPQDRPQFERLLGDGGRWGLDISFAEQPSPDGLPQAFLIGRRFLDGASCALVLGDNIFYGDSLGEILPTAARRVAAGEVGASVFAYAVRDPQRYGVVEFGADGRAVRLEEKPKEPRSRWAVTGLYLCGPDAPDLAASLRPSARGELEIVDLLGRYMDEGRLGVERLGRGYGWFDTGTHDSLLEAGEFVRAVQSRQGLAIACIEEIAWRKGLIGRDAVAAMVARMGRSSYADYLRGLLDAPADIP